MLGAVEASDGTGAPLRVPAGHVTVVLLALAVAGHRPVPADRLADLLWGDDPPARAANAVQVYVRRLRRVLGAGAVVTSADGYALDPAAGVDLTAVERLLDDASAARRTGRWQHAADLLGEALAHWRGPLGGVHGEGAWLLAERGRLEAAREQAELDRLDALVRAGRPGDALPEATVRAARHPLDERHQALLVAALAGSGRRLEALTAYRRTRVALRDELGLEPGPLLEAAYARVLQPPDPDAPADGTPGPGGRTPAPVHPILGRDADLAAVTGLLRADARLVTVTGPGGVGKTRFALEAAGRLERPGGPPVVWVPLSELTRADDVPGALAGALGLWDARPDALEAVVGHLRRSPALLVLDNFEHVAAAAHVVDRLLTDAAGTRCLVTSRTVLHVHGEHQHRLSPLPLDGAGPGPAEELLRARIRAVRPDLPFDRPTLAAVRRICRAVDGLPLALELAAARTAVLSPATIADQLEAAPADLAAPDAVVGGHRHRSLRALVGWSADLLTSDARMLLARLSVFRGGFTVDAATAVADHDGRFGGRVPDLLAQLRDASLVTTDAAGPDRLRMLVMVRESAASLLDADDPAALRRAHGRYYARFLDGATAGLPVQLPSTAAARAGLPETDNLRAALAAARDAGDAALLADLVAVLAPVLETGGSAAEVLAWVAAADDAGRSHPGAVPPARRCDLLLWRSRLVRDTGDVRDALTDAQDGLAAAHEAGDADRVAQATMLVAYWLAWFGEREQAAAHERALGAQVDAGLVRFPGMLRGLLGLVAVLREDPATAEVELRRGLAACRAAGEDLQALVLAGMLSEALLVAGRPGEAREVLSGWGLHALAGLAPRAATYPLTNRVVAALALGDTARVAADLPVVVRLADRSGDVVLHLELLRVLAAVAAAAGAWDDALLLLAGFAAHAERLGGDLDDASARILVGGLADEAVRRLGDERARAVRLTGAASALPALWDLARRIAADHAPADG